MFYLAATTIPNSSKEFAALLTAALQEFFEFPAGAAPVRVEGGAYPNVETVEIDLSGAEYVAKNLPPTPSGNGQLQPGPHAGVLRIFGHPVRHEFAAIDLDLTASEIRFDFDHDSHGRLLLRLSHVASGSVDVRIDRRELDHAIRDGAGALAAKHGVEVKDVRVDLEPINPRSVAARIEVVARKFVTATIRLTGFFAIDDRLNASLNDLLCHGEGMIGGFVCGLVQPRLNQVSGRAFPLMALSLDEVRLRDVRINVNNQSLQVRAEFGDAAS